MKEFTIAFGLSRFGLKLTFCKYEPIYLKIGWFFFSIMLLDIETVLDEWADSQEVD